MAFNLIIFSLIVTTLCQSPPAIKFYGEALCPYTASFIAYGYKDLITNPNRNLLVSSLEYIPFGKAKELADSVPGNRKFQCQHGPNECYGNYILNCAIQAIPNKFEQLNVCLAENFIKNKFSADFDNFVNICLDSTSAQIVLACAKSPLGGELMHNAGLKTGDLQGLPWIFLNNVHSEEIQDGIGGDTTNYLCEYNNLVGKVPGCPIPDPDLEASS